MTFVKSKRPIVLAALLWFSLYYDYTGIIRIGLLASVLHELGHILAWLICMKSKPILQFSPVGIALKLSGVQLTPFQMLIIAGAGPAANLLMWMLSWILLFRKASYWLYFFASSNLIIGLFNLIPFGFLDGRRILQALYALRLHSGRK